MPIETYKKAAKSNIYQNTDSVFEMGKSHPLVRFIGLTIIVLGVLFYGLLEYIESGGEVNALPPLISSLAYEISLLEFNLLTVYPTILLVTGFFVAVFLFVGRSETLYIKIVKDKVLEYETSFSTLVKKKHLRLPIERETKITWIKKQKSDADPLVIKLQYHGSNGSKKLTISEGVYGSMPTRSFLGWLEKHYPKQ